MYIILYLGNRRLPIIAPLGAALYTVRTSQEGPLAMASVLFALCKNGESVTQAAVRVLRDYSAEPWSSAVDCPSGEPLQNSSDALFAEYKFSFDEENQRWMLTEGADAEFFTRMMRITSSSGALPKTMYTDFKTWQAAANAREKLGVTA